MVIMNKENEKIYIVYTIFGAVLWFSAIILRDLNLSNDIYFNYILGVLPNFAVVFLAFGIGMIYYPILKKKISLPLKKYYSLIILILIWVLLLISEYLHQIFINSPWDNFDIIASGLATLIIFIFYYIDVSKLNSK